MGPANAFSHNVGISTAWAKLSIPVGAVAMAVMVLALIGRDIADLQRGEYSHFEQYGEIDAGDAEHQPHPKG